MCSPYGKKTANHNDDDTTSRESIHQARLREHCHHILHTTKLAMGTTWDRSNAVSLFRRLHYRTRESSCVYLSRAPGPSFQRRVCIINHTFVTPKCNESRFVKKSRGREFGETNVFVITLPWKIKLVPFLHMLTLREENSQIISKCLNGNMCLPRWLNLLYST